MLLFSTQALAAEHAQRVYQQSIGLAAQGEVSKAVVALQAASAVLPHENIWHERMLTAAALLAMQKHQQMELPKIESNTYQKLAEAYIQAHAGIEPVSIWPVAMLAVIFPGAGHAWQGRMRDAGVAALLVWPLFILTLWAAKRKMGPVTLFFAVLTIWFWSGTVFSAISLVERGSFETYMQWWQGLWQASALLGRPW